MEGVQVIDAHGTWMAQWTQDFGTLEIPHCRSHTDLHPCPFDFQSLRVWTEMQKREEEVWPMHYLEREEARAEGLDDELDADVALRIIEHSSEPYRDDDHTCEQMDLQLRLERFPAWGAAPSRIAKE